MGEGYAGHTHTHTHIYCSMGIYIKYIFTHMYSIYKDAKDRVFCFIDVALFIYIYIYDIIFFVCTYKGARWKVFLRI